MYSNVVFINNIIIMLTSVTNNLNRLDIFATLIYRWRCSEKHPTSIYVSLPYSDVKHQKVSQLYQMNFCH